MLEEKPVYYLTRRRRSIGSDPNHTRYRAPATRNTSSHHSEELELMSRKKGPMLVIQSPATSGPTSNSDSSGSIGRSAALTDSCWAINPPSHSGTFPNGKPAPRVAGNPPPPEKPPQVLLQENRLHQKETLPRQEHVQEARVEGHFFQDIHSISSTWSMAPATLTKRITLCTFSIRKKRGRPSCTP